MTKRVNVPAAPPVAKVLDKVLTDALGSFPDGVNMGVDPLLLPPTQLALATNATVRGTFLSHRPPFNQVTLTYSGNIQTAVETGVFQGATYYKPDTGNEALIASISGKLFLFTIAGSVCTVSEVTPSTGAGNTTAIQAWLWQSESFAIRQDGGLTRPFVYDATANSGLGRLAYNGTDVLAYIGAGAGADVWSNSPGGAPNGSLGDTTNGAFTVPARGSVAVTLTNYYVGSLNTWIFASWTVAAIKYFAVFLVTANSGHAITLQNQTGADVTLPTGTTVKQGAVSNTYPAVGQTSDEAWGVSGLNAGGTYAGPYEIIVQAWQVVAPDGVPTPAGLFKVLPYIPAVGPIQNATLKNISDTAANIVPAGSVIYTQTTSTQYVPFAQLTAQLRLRNGESGTATLSAAYTGANGTQITIGGNLCTVGSGSGTATLSVTNNGPDFACSAGTQVASSQTVTTNQQIGVTAQSFTVPAVNSSVNVVLATRYTGSALQSCYIGTANYQISQFTTTPGSAATVTLENIDANPSGHFRNGATYYTYFSQVPELPSGKMGAYVQGRNWVAMADGRSYWASDLVGESSGTPPSFRDAVLKGVTNDYLLGGGTFAVPGSPADIRAIFGTQQLDAALGQGPVMVGIPNLIYSNNAPPDRTSWQNLTFPIQTVSCLGAGPLAQNSTVTINGDTIFRSKQGFFSLIMARRDFNVWGLAPISREIGPLIAADSQLLLDRSSAINFDNRYIATINPVSCSQGVYHTGFVALDFDTISSLRGKAPSVWEGSWTGYSAFQLVTGSFQGVDRGFFFNFNTSTSKIELWEITSSGAAQQYDNNNTAIVTRMESAGMDFGQKDPRQRKLLRLIDGEICVDKLVGTVDFQAYYKPDQYPEWVPWFSWSETANGSVTPNYRPRMGLSEPSPRNMDFSTNSPLREAYTFQFALVITGQCQFRGARFWAVPVPEPAQAPFSRTGIAGSLNRI